MAIGAFSFLPTNALQHYQKFYLLQCFVAGFRYYKGMELLAEIKEGDMLELVREPHNEYDDCAIALHWNKHKIGFVPAEHNEVLCRLLDAHALPLMAEVTHLNKEVQPWENLCMAVYFLKETTLAALPSEQVYLTELRTPEYTSYKGNHNVVTRIAAHADCTETETDWYAFLERNSRNDSIYSIIHESDVLPNYAYGEDTGAYLLLNKKRLPANDALQQIARRAEEAMGTMDNLFDEDGYIVVTTNEVAQWVPKLERIADVADKLGRHFIELKF